MLYINGRQGGGFFNNIGCLIVGVLLMFGLFTFLGWLFDILWYASPVLVVATAIIRHQVILQSFKNAWALLQRNPIAGVLWVAAAVFLFPILALYWFMAALGGKKIDQMKEQMGQQIGSEQSGGWGNFGQRRAPRQEDFADYEELESKPKTADEPKPKAAERPEIIIKKPEDKKKPQNPYDGLFE